MKLLKVRFDHLRMFEGGVLDIDLYASDRVPASDESAHALARSVYSNNVIALAGINATGKTTLLNLFELACRAVGGLPLAGGGLPSAMPTLFDGAPSLRCLVWHDGAFYLIESRLAPGRDDRPMAFAEEIVSTIPGGALRKSDLVSWAGLESAATVLARRSDIDGELAALASPDVSIASAVLTRRGGERARVAVVRGGGFRLEEAFDGLDDVLRVFDPSIEHLEVADSGRAFVLTFEGSKPVPLSEQGLVEVLSSGTVRGLGLVQRSLSALRGGGLLLVDEIENHLNRQLVNVVLDLFASRETNPNGATLVFTTHYPQLLDHVHRKDNVFFLVRGGGGTSVVKYSDRVKRIENKKSEVFASNYVKGTAPRYSDVKALKDLVTEGVSDG
jgi:hypothetical protein